MKIVNIIGGLGNQMFQFAFYLSISRRYSAEEIKICTAAFNGYGLHNSYELDTVFGIHVPEATPDEVKRLAWHFSSYRQWQIMNHLLPKRKNMFKDKVFGKYYDDVFQCQHDCFYDGYWQNEHYFSDMRDELLATFTPMNVDTKNSMLAAQMQTSNSVSIHIRRGDYLNSKQYRGLCDIDYYQRAVSKISKLTKVDVFYIFSNDIQWCNQNIIPLLGETKYIVVDRNKGDKSCQDMYLMSQCHHNIIANSSFSWWAAWLNQHTDKIIIGPERWINKKNSEFQLPQEWLKM